MKGGALMKTFDDFLNEVSDSDLHQHLKSAQQMLDKSLSKDEAIIHLCGVQTLYYLEKYHEWLCKSLTDSE